MVPVKYNGAVSKYPDENVLNVDKWRYLFHIYLANFSTALTHS